MAKEHTTPLVLWICAAVCAHYMFAQGGGFVAKMHEDRSYVSLLGSKARERARLAQTQTFDVMLPGDDDKGPEIEKKDPDPTKDEAKPPVPPEQAKVEPPTPIKPPEVDKKKEEERPKLKLVVKEEDPLKKLDAPPPVPEKRIAVRQHAKKDQEDNPNAKFIGDEANHVEDETVATQTSHDQNDPNPTPGGNHAGPKGQVGDSERTKIAESDEHKGEKNRAPGEKGTEFDVQPDPMPQKPTAPVAVAAVAAAQAPRSGGDGKPVQAAQTAPTRPPEPTMAPGAPQPASPEVVQGSAGSWTFNPIKPNPGTGTAPDPAQGSAAQKVQPPPGATKWLGLGGTPGPGQININLSHQGVVAAVGADQLKKERVAEGERRKSEHRGSWQASNFERWRSAIENYVSTVKPGNQTALNTARVPFATYINNIHNRIHPIFADSFLDSLDGLPHTHPLNNPRMYTSLEIVLTKEGRLVKMGVVHTSGVTAFDIAALDSVQRASPFGPAPNAILSGDGNVYLHWEFHRNRDMACTTFNAYPYILNLPAPPPTPEAPPGDPKGPPTRERGAPPPANVPETREGKNAPPRAPLPRAST